MTASPAGPPAGSSPGPRGGSPAPIPPAPKPSPPGIRALFALRDARRRWPFALRAAVCMGTPVLAGWAAGNTTAGLMGTIGAFTSLYGSGRPYLNRSLHLAVIAVALGAILRRSAAAITIAVVIIVMPFLLSALNVLPAGAGDWLLRLTPAAGLAIEQSIPRYAQVTTVISPVQGYYPLSPYAGFAVLCLWTAAALALALVLLRRRDA